MRIAILGAAELGKLITSHAISDCKYEVVGYYDDFNIAKTFNNYPILGKIDSVLSDYKSDKFDAIIIGIGYNQMNARVSIFTAFKNIIPFANIIHSSAYIDVSCKLGEGIFILPGVVIDLDVIIEDNVLLNTGTIIAHHTKIGQHTFIAPGVNIAGLVDIGSKCFIGIGSIIKDCITIANSSTIGAGSLVLKNTEENSISLGAPAKTVKYNKPMKKNILVTAVGGRSVGSGILHALTRSSQEVNDRWNIVASDADSFSWGLYKVNQKTLLPFANSPDYISSVQEAIAKFNIHAIIPGSEPEANVLSQNKNAFNIPIITNSFELMPLMMDKFVTAKKLKILGLPTIPTYKIEDWETAITEFGFPVIIKPTTGTGGSKGVSLCTNLTQIKTIITNLPEKSGYCIQPIIGSDDEEYTVGVLSDKNGKLLDSIVMKRKLIGLSLLDTKKIDETKISISTGYSQGFFIKNEFIQTFCEKLATTLGSIGPLNIQLRVHKGEIYVFEIHPRFSGTTTMRADVGFNEPDILLRNYLFDEEFNRLNYRNNVAAIRAFEHVIVPIDEML